MASCSLYLRCYLCLTVLLHALPPPRLPPRRTPCTPPESEKAELQHRLDNLQRFLASEKAGRLAALSALAEAQAALALQGQHLHTAQQQLRGNQDLLERAALTQQALEKVRVGGWRWQVGCAALAQLVLEEASGVCGGVKLVQQARGKVSGG